MGLDLAPDSEGLQNFTLLLSTVLDTDFTSPKHVQQLEDTAAVLMGWNTLPDYQRGIIGTTQVGKAARAFIAALESEVPSTTQAQNSDCISRLRQAFRESGLLALVTVQSGTTPAWADHLRERPFGEWQAQKAAQDEPATVAPPRKNGIVVPKCNTELLIDSDEVRAIYEIAKQNLSPYSLYVLTARTLYKPEHQLSYAKIADTVRSLNPRIAAEPISDTTKRLSVIAAIAKKTVNTILEQRGIPGTVLNYSPRPAAAVPAPAPSA